MTLGNSGMKVLTNVFSRIQPTLRLGSDAGLFKSRIKNMKSSASERIRNVYFNLEQLTHSSRLAWQGIPTLDRLWTALIKMPNFCKQFDQNEHFPPFKLSSAAIKIGVWVTSAALNNFGWPSFQLGSPHEKVSIWTRPNFTFAPIWYRTLECLVMNVCTLGRYYKYVYFYFRHLEFEPSGFETWNGVLGQKTMFGIEWTK